MITANPDIVEEDLTNDINFIVIACDGIWDCLSNQECCDFISERLKKNPNILLSKIIEEMFDSIIASDIYSSKKINIFLYFFNIFLYFFIFFYIFLIIF
jgi:serine/threonine protein phosphatase PrpC